MGGCLVLDIAGILHTFTPSFHHTVAYPPSTQQHHLPRLRTVLLYECPWVCTELRSYRDYYTRLDEPRLSLAAFLAQGVQLKGQGCI